MTSLETVFRIANFAAVIGWIVLALAAAFGWRGALERFCGRLVPVLLAAAYVVLLVAYWSGTRGDFSSLSGVQTLFRQPAAALAGWLHYLAFDLLIGTAIAQRFLADRLPRTLLIPILPLTFLFGPAGWLLFQAILFARQGSTSPAGAKRTKRA